MIYDVFLFLNEFDILDIRYAELESVVDKFILIEAPFTYTLKDKPYFYKHNVGRHKDKVHCISIPQEDMKHVIPKSAQDIHYVERFQRNYVRSYLREVCKDDDIVIFGDIDEIPRVDTIKAFRDLGLSEVRFATKLYRYYFNLYFQDWQHGHIFKWRKLQQWINNFQDIRTKCKPPMIKSSYGWHFSSVGKFEDIMYKLSNFSHANETRVKKQLSEGHISNMIKLKQHPFKKGKDSGRVVSIDTMPAYIQEFQDSFKDLLLDI